MKKYLLVLIGCGFVAGFSSFIHFSKPNEAVDFPEGYRQWNHIKTHLVGPNNPAWPRYGGFNHFYANDKALEGYRTNKWPDGAIVVVDVREGTEIKGDYAWGKIKFIDVMVKDRKKYASTGGWGFEKFMEGDKTKPQLTEERRIVCFDCHSSRAGDADLVLSTYKE